jgi:hypothetical protein
MNAHSKTKNDEAIQELALSFDIRHSGFVIRH